MEDIIDYEEQDESFIRPSIVDMVDNLQWLDQVQDKQKKEIEREIKAKQASIDRGDSSLAERCLICTLPMGTCEHTRAWTLRHQEAVYIAQEEAKSALQAEIADTFDGLLSKDNVHGQENDDNNVRASDEIAIEHMAWMPLEERNVDFIDAHPAKLSSPHDRVWHSSVLLDGFVVVFGGLKTSKGMNPLLTSELHYLNDVRAYDLFSQAWKTLKIRPDHQDTDSESGESEEEGNEVEDEGKYTNNLNNKHNRKKKKSKKNQKHQKLAMPAPRYGHAAAAITKDSFVVFGGRGERGRVFQDTWLFDLRTCIWTLLDTSRTSFASPAPRFFSAACADLDVIPTSEAEDAGVEAELAEDRVSTYNRRYLLNNRSRRSVFLFGGTNGSDNFDDLWRFRLHYCEDLSPPEKQTKRNNNEADNSNNSENNSDNNSKNNNDDNDNFVLEDDYYDPDEIESNVKLDEEVTAEQRLAVLLQRSDHNHNTLSSHNNDNNNDDKKKKKRSTQTQQGYILRVEGVWERCVAAGVTPCARYGHTVTLLRRPVQPPGLRKHQQTYNNHHHNSNYINTAEDEEEDAEERFLLILGGCHVSPAAEVSVGSEASSQETAALLSLASHLQRCYLQENLSSVLSASQLRLRLQQELQNFTTNGHDVNSYHDSVRLSQKAAEALSQWLQQAGAVSSLLALRERDTRQAEQLLVDAFKLHRATQQWKMTGKNMGHAARHSETHLDIHWLRLPPPPTTLPRKGSDAPPRHLLALTNNNSASNDTNTSSSINSAMMDVTDTRDLLQVLQWEVSQLGQTMGLQGAGKFRPSARMHFGASVLRHQREARFLLVLGGVEPTSLAHLPPTVAKKPRIHTNDTHNNAANSAHTNSHDTVEEEMSVYVLDLRTMVWTKPSPVNSQFYQKQTLAMAKAEYLRAKDQLKTLEQTAIALLGRTRHLSVTASTQNLRQNLDLEHILEVKQAQVFCEVCRWRMETLYDSYRIGRRFHNTTNHSNDNNTNHSNTNNNSDIYSAHYTHSSSSITSNGSSNSSLTVYVPGKKIVSLLDQKHRHKHHQNHQNNIHTNNNSAVIQANNNSNNNSNKDHNSVHSFSEPMDSFAFEGLYEGYAGFALTRLGQRLVLVGGAFFPANANANANSSSNPLTHAHPNSDNISTNSSNNNYSDDVHSVNSTSNNSVSVTRLRQALQPACAVVLDMEAQSVKQTRWRRNYYASLEIFRKKEEAKLQMEALVSLHAIREAQRLENETRQREIKHMSYEDYRSHIPPLSQPAPVTLGDLHKVNAHSIWVVWDDVLDIAAVTMRRLRYNKSHLLGGRHHHHVHHVASRSRSMVMDAATATSLLYKFHQVTTATTNTHANSNGGDASRNGSPNTKKRNQIVSKLSNTANNSSSHNVKAAVGAAEPDMSTLLAAIANRQELKQQQQRRQHNDPTNRHDQQDHNAHNNPQDSSDFITYFLHAQVGYESLLPGDIVDVLPKKITKPNISFRPVCADHHHQNSDANSSTSNSSTSNNHHHHQEYHNQQFEPCDLFFDDLSTRFRGVLLKPSVMSSRPGHFTVKYLDKTLETLVSRHRIRRVYRPPPDQLKVVHEDDHHRTNSHTNDDHTTTNNDYNQYKSNSTSNHNGNENWDFRLDLNFHNNHNNDNSHNNHHHTKKSAFLPTVLPDPQKWTLLYAGPDTHYAVTNLLPRHVLDSEPDLKIAVVFSVQTHGMDSPDYERSQLSHPVIIHTQPANQNSTPNHNNNQLLLTNDSPAEAPDMSSSSSVVSLMSLPPTARVAGSATNSVNADKNTNTTNALALIPSTNHSKKTNDNTNNGGTNGMSRTRKQVVSAVIQARHLQPPPDIPLTIQDSDDPAGLYKTRHIVYQEPLVAPTELSLPAHLLPLVLKSDIVPSDLDERFESATAATVSIVKQDNFCWAEGQGDHYA